MFFSNIYKNKKVLITGHTGFKGSWLTIWLLMLGAKVIGVSINNNSKLSHFSLLKIKKRIKNHFLDINKYNNIIKIFKKYKPDIVFHLAAQSLVFESYKKPLETIKTNSMGTANILECIKNTKSVKAAVIVTSDKAYFNNENKNGYKETDRLAGEDPYSCSKSCAEIIFSSYYKSFFLKNKFISSVRAGNVIGGGDWSKNRIIPDAFIALIKKKKLIIKNPNSIRPWQHVLDPISAYLLLGKELIKKNNHCSGQSFNVGPKNTEKVRVIDLLNKIKKKQNNFSYKIKKNNNNFNETMTLMLNSKKIKKIINWSPTLNINETIDFTLKWYQNYIKKNIEIKDLAEEQIKNYCNIAIKKKASWTKR